MRGGAGANAVRRHPRGRGARARCIGPGLQEVRETRRAHLVGRYGTHMHPFCRHRRPVGAVIRRL